MKYLKNPFFSFILIALLFLTGPCLPAFGIEAPPVGEVSSDSQEAVSSQPQEAGEKEDGDEQGLLPEVEKPSGAKALLPQQWQDISGEGSLPSIAGEGAVLIDACSGQILYQKNMDQSFYPASTTKILTAILTLEHMNLQQEVTIDREAAYTNGSRIYLIEDEVVTVEELMYAMMLESANDAAVALAKAIGGTVEDFSQMMNERAKELGAENTHFTNPNGLPDQAHTTTAYDLAMMARKGMEYDAFRHFVGTVSYEMQPTNKQSEIRIFNNSNRLLFDQSRKFDYDGTLVYGKYEGATGIKTGYTQAAGSCIVASAKRQDRELIAVVLKSRSEQIFVDAMKLLDYGFTYYDSRRGVEAGETLATVRVKNGGQDKVAVTAGEDIALTVPAGHQWEEFEISLDVPSSVKAPVKEGDSLGTVTVSYGGQVIGTADAVAAAAVPPETGLFAPDSLPGKVLGILKWILAGALALLVLFVVFVLLVNHLYRKKKRAERKGSLSGKGAGAYQNRAGRKEGERYLSRKEGIKRR